MFLSPPILFRRILGRISPRAQNSGGGAGTWYPQTDTLTLKQKVLSFNQLGLFVSVRDKVTPSKKSEATRAVLRLWFNPETGEQFLARVWHESLP